ncbi:MAG: peptide chain release factor N(5)-glutamine methyltransferase [Planctomycetota bacterium]|nr:MAG: peptide chain release factor N(5)-glutamine methyltransferase [Planctomycetota bacterium]
MEQWTIQKLLDWMNGYFTEKAVDAPRLTAELLLCHVLGCRRIELYTNFDRVVDQAGLAELRRLVKRCAEHEPVAYLVGRCEFYSLAIKVNKSCLIPRPETELLVERAIDFLRARQTPAAVLDLCTGSGCVAIAIAKNVADCRLTATDVSDEALSIADANIKTHALADRIRLLCGDLFDPIVAGLDETSFDLIVSNPPYVSAAEFDALDKNVRDYEPRQALYGGVDGLDVYRRIAEKIEPFLRPDGALILEIGYAQGPAIRQLLEETALFKHIKVEKDHSNNDRIVTAHKA